MFTYRQLSFCGDFLLDILKLSFNEMSLKTNLKSYSLLEGPFIVLTHWGRLMHMCVSTLTIIGSDNGLSPARHLAIIWTNDWILIIGPWGTNFNEILIKIQQSSSKKMALNMSSVKWQTFCLGLNVLTPSVCLVLTEWWAGLVMPHCVCGTWRLVTAYTY